MDAAGTGAIGPTLVLTAAVMVGAGIYLIQRSRFIVPVMIRHVPYLRTRPHVARRLLMLLMTVGILMAGVGCRILFEAARG